MALMGRQIIVSQLGKNDSYDLRFSDALVDALHLSTHKLKIKNPKLDKLKNS